MNSAPQRILIRSTNWIGDVVMSLPAMREVRRLHPDAHLAVVARDWVADLYRGQGLADEIISFPDSTGPFCFKMHSRPPYSSCSPASMTAWATRLNTGAYC